MEYNVFQFSDLWYHQISNTAMGTSVVPIYAHLYYGIHKTSVLLPTFILLSEIRTLHICILISTLVWTKRNLLVCMTFVILVYKNYSWDYIFPRIHIFSGTNFFWVYILLQTSIYLTRKYLGNSQSKIIPTF